MQGLSQNKYQFSLLVLINAFVGAMVGLERAVIPGLARSEFGIDANSAILSFVAAFGISKALSNYSVLRLTRRYNRKTVLIIGWLFALPVPVLLMYAETWNWVIAANILLGINQGLAWSSTVIMKIDLVGNRQRGLAMGINEFAGYLAVGLASFLASGIASRYGYSYFPFLPGIFFALAGLALSVFLVRDTSRFVQAESSLSAIPLLENVWKSATWRHKNISSVTLAGLVNNMNDAVVWGLLPLLLLQRDFSIYQVGIIVGIYPVVWGLSQLLTGALGDHFCKKQLIISGMILQALAIVLLAISSGLGWLIFSSVLLGLGTALVYPNFLTVVAENTHPLQRAETLSIFRFWRDSGYVAGALVAGFLADVLGLINALLIIAALTAGAGIVAHIRMCCTLKKIWPDRSCVVIQA